MSSSKTIPPLIAGRKCLRVTCTGGRQGQRETSMQEVEGVDAVIIWINIALTVSFLLPPAIFSSQSSLSLEKVPMLYAIPIWFLAPIPPSWPHRSVWITPSHPWALQDLIHCRLQPRSIVQGRLPVSTLTPAISIPLRRVARINSSHHCPRPSPVRLERASWWRRFLPWLPPWSTLLLALRPWLRVAICSGSRGGDVGIACRSRSIVERWVPMDWNLAGYWR